MTLAGKIVLPKHKFAFLLFLLSVILNNFVFSQEKEQSNIIRVGYYENEIFQEGARDGVPKTGYAYEYYRKIAEYTGWKYNYVYGDFSELYKKLENGEIDLLAGLAYDPKRTGKIDYPALSMGSTSYVLVKRTANQGVSSVPETLNGKKIGVVESVMVSLLDSWLKSHKVAADVYTYQAFDELENKLENGFLDVILVEGSGYYDRDDFESILKIGQSDYYLCANKNRPELVERLNEVQSQIAYDNPTYFGSLYTKYYPKSVISRAFSKIENEWIDNHNEIRIAFLNNYLPFSDVDKKGNVTGLIKELIPEIIKTLNLTNITSVKYIPYDSTELMIQALDEDKVDVVFPIGGGLNFLESREIYQSESVVRASVNLVHHKNFKPDNPSRFAVNKKNIMQENYIKSNYPDAELIYCDSITECFDLVKKEKNVCTTTNSLRTRTLLKTYKYDSLDYRTLTNLDERSFGVKVGSEGLLQILNRGLNNIANQHVLDIAYKYTENLYKYSVGDFFKNNAVFILIAVFLLAAVIMLFLVQDRIKKQVYLENQKKKNEELDKAKNDLLVQLDIVNKLNLEIKHSHDNIAHSVTEMIRFASSEENADKVLNQLITYIGTKLRSDRSYIFECNSKGSYDNTYEWCNKGVTPQKNNLQNVPYEGVVEIWDKEFENSNNIVVGNIDIYKDKNNQLYEILKAQDIKTLVAVPLKNGGKITGFIGIDNPPEENLDYISDFFSLVEFIFSMMIRIRNNTDAIKESAVHDQLTGCQNRKALSWAYEENFVLNQACAIVSIDMNGLKKINDSQGHEAGDKFICRTAEALVDIYGKDKVYRMGGDEFIVVILGISREEFDKLNNSCKLLLGNTASMGVVYEEKIGNSFENLLKQSDQNMYREKERFYQENKR